MSTAVALASDAEVKELILFHHDPTHNDAMIDKMTTLARTSAQQSGKTLKVVPAQEGLEIVLNGAQAAARLKTH